MAPDENWKRPFPDIEIDIFAKKADFSKNKPTKVDQYASARDILKLPIFIVQSGTAPHSCIWQRAYKLFSEYNI